MTNETNPQSRAMPKVSITSNIPCDTYLRVILDRVLTEQLRPFLRHVLPIVSDEAG